MGLVHFIHHPGLPNATIGLRLAIWTISVFLTTLPKDATQQEFIESSGQIRFNMYTRPVIRLKLVIFALGLMLALLVLTGCFVVVLSQQLPSATDSLVKQNDLLQRATQAMKEQNQENELRDPEMEIDGLIISETLTKIGVDFYDLFYQRWAAPPSASGYEIRIEELPAPGFGTIIVVKVNETTIFQRVLQPRYDQLEASADLAVALTQRHVNDQQRLTQQLYEEDQQGTGIY